MHRLFSVLVTLFLPAVLIIPMGCGTNSQGHDPSQSAANPATHDTVRSELARDASPDVSEQDFSELISGNHSFALGLYQSLRAVEGNLLVSPLSIRMAFGLLQAGANGETENEIEQALQFGLSQESLHPAFNKLDLELAKRNWPGDENYGSIELHVANAFWGQEGHPWKEDYLDTLALHYGAGVEALDFANKPNDSRLTINEWVEAKTNDRIQDLLPLGSITLDTASVLTNALYFKAPWATPFKKGLTQSKPFSLLDGTETQVDMMQAYEAFGYTSAEDYQALEIPYHQHQLAMVFILPSEGSFSEFETNLTTSKLDQVLADLEYKTGSVSIPKFTFDSDFALSDSLKSMGMTTVFSQADLSGMTDMQNLYIDEVYHKTFIAVDEEGSEAAAATAIVVGIESAAMEEFEFNANRPFLFAIRDTVTGVILFMGRVTNP